MPSKLCLLFCSVVILVLLTSCGAPQQRDSVAVVQAFYDAASAEDIEAFAALLADDAEMDWGREGLVIGKEEIRRKAELLFLDLDFTFTLKYFVVDGKRVTFEHKMVLDGTQTVIEECVNEVVVEGGRIKSAHLITCEYPGQ